MVAKLYSMRWKASTGYHIGQNSQRHRLRHQGKTDCCNKCSPGWCHTPIIAPYQAMIVALITPAFVRLRPSKIASTRSFPTYSIFSSISCRLVLESGDFIHIATSNLEYPLCRFCTNSSPSSTDSYPPSLV